MNAFLAELARSIGASGLHDTTVHLLGIAVVMSSVVLLDLRILGLALPSQGVQELTRRVMPWLWSALPVMVVSGLPFVSARPQRYFSNPIFGWKFSLLLPAIALAGVLHVVSVRKPDFWDVGGSRAAVKVLAFVSLLLWIGVVLAGRWIGHLS